MSTFRKIVDSIDPSTEELAAQKEAVDKLSKLAESRAEFFELQISTNLRTAGGQDNQTVPVEAILNSTMQTHAFTSNHSGVIGNVVSEALKSFCSGSKSEILTGVGSLISNALTAFLGGGSAQERTLKQYYVMTEGLSIIRVDLMAWSLGVEAKGIRKKVEQASAFVAVKSAVDLAKVKFNTFLALYQNQLSSMGLDQKALHVALAETKEIYRQFHDDVALTSIVPPPAESLPLVAAFPG